MARTTMLIDDDLLLELKRLARAQGTTATKIVREALETYVARRRRPRLPSFAKAGKSGRRAIAQTAEEILRKRVDTREGW